MILKILVPHCFFKVSSSPLIFFFLLLRDGTGLVDEGANLVDRFLRPVATQFTQPGSGRPHPWKNSCDHTSKSDNGVTSRSLIIASFFIQPPAETTLR